MTPSELKTTLERLDWQFAPEHSNSGVDWYAYQRLSGVEDCTSNERPPNLILVPHELLLPNLPEPYRTVTLSITGEVGGGVWLKLEAYSIAMDQVLATIPRAKALLVTAWNSAARLTPEHAASA